MVMLPMKEQEIIAGKVSLVGETVHRANSKRRPAGVVKIIGRDPYEEITVFLFGHPDVVAEPSG
jgi:hypothetical protein